MTSALVHINGLGCAPQLVCDLGLAGVQVLGGAHERSKLVQGEVHEVVHGVVRYAPDIVIFDDPTPGEALFKTTQAIADAAPCPVLVFTSDGDADHIVRATESGVHAYVVNGYGAHRLRALIQLAQARFRYEQGLREALLDVSRRFEDRKMVERAKGILMHARQVSDDDAFQVLRTVSMHTNRRLGQVSQHIIASAQVADTVNRAGQLRMLSQRLVKLHVLALAGVNGGQCREQLQQSVLRIDVNLTLLAKTLSQTADGDALAQLVQTWEQLKQALQRPESGAAFEAVDGLAEQLLQGAERLTASLESTGSMPPLRVLNMAGRQRMLSQRFAKQAVMGLLGDAGQVQRSEVGRAETRQAFEQALTYLNGLPLSTPSLHDALQSAGIGWLHMLAAARDAGRASGPQRLARLADLAQASEGLLDVFEHLSTQYEHSMQMLVGS